MSEQRFDLEAEFNGIMAGRGHNVKAVEQIRKALKQPILVTSQQILDGGFNVFGLHLFLESIGKFKLNPDGNNEPIEFRVEHRGVNSTVSFRLLAHKDADARGQDMTVLKMGVRGVDPAEQNRLRYVGTHEQLDQLSADFLSAPGNKDKRPSNTTMMEMMEWSHKRTLEASGDR